MYLIPFISKGIFLNSTQTKSVSNSIINLCIIGVSTSIVVMVVTTAIIFGYQHQISEKIMKLNGHIQISDFNQTMSHEPLPMSINNGMIKQIKSIPNVAHIQSYVVKNGMIKTKTENYGVVLKGVSYNYALDFIKSNLIEGVIFNLNQHKLNNGVLISQLLANKLHLKVNHKMIVYFLTKKNNQHGFEFHSRAFEIKGIFNSNFEDFDKQVVLIDIQHLQKLNNWDSTQVAGYELFVTNLYKLNQTNQTINETLNYQLIAKTTPETQSFIFKWLEVLNYNAVIILVLMFLVVSANMISAILVLILEKTSIIGILRVLGLNIKQIQILFFNIAFKILIKGLLIGNSIGIILCLIQKQFGIIKLNPSIYFLSEVPIEISWLLIIVLNLVIIFLCMLTLFIPTLVLKKMTLINIINSQ